MEIIPAIDIIDGKCVRLTKGDFNRKTVYDQHPLEVALQFQEAGLKRLHLVDLDGARTGAVVNLKVLENIASQTKLVVDFGGGVQSDEDIQKVFDAGAAQVTGGSIAVRNPALFESWLVRYGAERIILGADVKNEMVAISGWQEQANYGIWDFITNYSDKGIRYIICTDVNKDGLLKGPSIALYRQLVAKFSQIKIIASGGVSSLTDLHELKKSGVSGAIIGKAIYEGAIPLKELSKF